MDTKTEIEVTEILIEYLSKELLKQHEKLTDLKAYQIKQNIS